MNVIATAIALHAACFGVGEIQIHQRDSLLDMPAVQACFKTDSLVFYSVILPRENLVCKNVWPMLIEAWQTKWRSWGPNGAPTFDICEVELFSRGVSTSPYRYGQTGMRVFLASNDAHGIANVTEYSQDPVAVQTDPTSMDALVARNRRFVELLDVPVLPKLDPIHEYHARQRNLAKAVQTFLTALISSDSPEAADLIDYLTPPFTRMLMKIPAKEKMSFEIACSEMKQRQRAWLESRELTERKFDSAGPMKRELIFELLVWHPQPAGTLGLEVQPIKVSPSDERAQPLGRRFDLWQHLLASYLHPPEPQLVGSDGRGR